MLAVHTQSTKSWATSRTATWSKSMAGKRLTSSWSSAWVTSGFFAVSASRAGSRVSSLHGVSWSWAQSKQGILSRSTPR